MGFNNYFNYISDFDWLVIAIGSLFLLTQIIIIIPLRKRIKKKLEKIDSESEKISIINESKRHRFTWIKGAGIVREMIGLLPFFGILGTVVGLLNTLDKFKDIANINNISVIVKDFAPAMTSTITAIVFTIINMIIFNAFILPPIIENEDISKKPIFTRKKDRIIKEK